MPAGKTVLLALELGVGLGHLPALRAIAEGLRPLGVRLVLALPGPQAAAGTLSTLGLEIVAAPHWPQPTKPTRPSGSYADVLCANGHANAAQSAQLIGDWDRLIDAIRPDAIVCEHAPTAAISAYGRIPVALVGSGFTVPPADEARFPANVPDRGTPEAQDVVLAAVAGGLQALGRAAPPTLTAPFRTAFRGVYSLPLTDAYRHARRETVLGPIESLPALSPWPAQRRLFAYSTWDLALVDRLMRSLMDIGPAASVFFRDHGGPRSAILRSRGIEVFDTAPDLAAVLPRVSAVFSHAGSGFTHAALAAGRPQILHPLHFEAQANARGVVAAGCGIMLDSLDSESLRAAFARASSDDALQAMAQRRARETHDFVVAARARDVTIAAITRLLA